LEIRVDGNDIEKAIRLLKRKIQRDGIFRELKNKRFYEKPSLNKEKKTERSAEAKAEEPPYEQAGTVKPRRGREAVVKQRDVLPSCQEDSGCVPLVHQHRGTRP
jgi:small subunit ribosomal protein S21